jgi:hypothetical protein
LGLLQSALDSSYPPNRPSAPPLKFDLEVIESKPPTADQLTTILSYRSPQDSSTHSISAFISAHPSSPSPDELPQNADGIVRLATQNPNVFKWPVVVDWTEGMATIGTAEGVKTILEVIRKRRDGEIKEEAEYQPRGWFS